MVGEWNYFKGDFGSMKRNQADVREQPAAAPDTTEDGSGRLKDRPGLQQGQKTSQLNSE